MMKKIYAIIILVLFFGGAVYLALWNNRSADLVKEEPDAEQILCTLEVFICPDGTAVGRQGPKCEFAACPGTDPKTTALIGVGETKTINDVQITVNKIVEDSRCPIDAVCIQAGKLVASVTLKSASGQQTVNLTDDQKAVTFGSAKVTLLRGDPFPMASNPTPFEQYKLTFKVEKN